MAIPLYTTVGGYRFRTMDLPAVAQNLFDDSLKSRTELATLQGAAKARDEEYDHLKAAYEGLRDQNRDLRHRVEIYKDACHHRDHRGVVAEPELQYHGLDRARAQVEPELQYDPAGGHWTHTHHAPAETETEFYKKKAQSLQDEVDHLREEVRKQSAYVVNEREEYGYLLRQHQALEDQIKAQEDALEAKEEQVAAERSVQYGTSPAYVGPTGATWAEPIPDTPQHQAAFEAGVQFGLRVAKQS